MLFPGFTLSASSLGFRDISRPWFLASPSARKVGSGVVHLPWTSAKRLSAGHDAWLYRLSSSPRLRESFERVRSGLAARAVASPAPGAPCFSDVQVFSRRGPACQDCGQFARWVGPRRLGLAGRRRTALRLAREGSTFGRGSVFPTLPGPCLAPAQVSFLVQLPDQ